MGRTSSSYARNKPKYKPEPRVLVICEDSKSCLVYLDDAARHFRANFQVEIIHADRTDPLGIVSIAINRQNSYDKVFCAIDRDGHKGFNEALAMADLHKTKVRVIVSYPCYEYWLLLHFKKSRKPYVAAGSRSPGDVLVNDLQLEEGMAGYAKGGTENVFKKLESRLPDAIERASQVLTEASMDGALNPSTRLHELILEFRELGSPKLIA